MTNQIEPGHISHIPNAVPAAVTLDVIDVNLILKRRETVRKIMAGLMTAGVHFSPGKPATEYTKEEKPSLLKPGAEVLLMSFQIAAKPNIEDLSDEEHIRYRVTATGIYIPSAVVVGEGVGECSTAEEKYSFREAVNEAEYQATTPQRRRIKYSAWRGEQKEIKQVRRNPFDLGNTVLKMAKKRALVDLALTALAASDCFTQDMEDDEENVQFHTSEREQRKAPAKPIPTGKAEEPKEPNAGDVTGKIESVGVFPDGDKKCWGVQIAGKWFHTFQIEVGERGVTFKNITVHLVWEREEGGNRRIIKKLEKA